VDEEFSGWTDSGQSPLERSQETGPIRNRAEEFRRPETEHVEGVAGAMIGVSGTYHVEAGRMKGGGYIRILGIIG
jgi:hypothetical protein